MKMSCRIPSDTSLDHCATKELVKADLKNVTLPNKLFCYYLLLLPFRKPEAGYVCSLRDRQKRETSFMDILWERLYLSHSISDNKSNHRNIVQLRNSYPESSGIQINSPWTIQALQTRELLVHCWREIHYSAPRKWIK